MCVILSVCVCVCVWVGGYILRPGAGPKGVDAEDSKKGQNTFDPCDLIVVCLHHVVKKPEPAV